MDKAEARQKLEALGLPSAQAKAARRTITRATASETLEIGLAANGDLVIQRKRPGRNGFQVFEDTIQADGFKQVVQKAFDANGNLVHVDPKGGTP